MLSFLLGVFVISLSGVMLPGPMFAVTVAKGYRSRFAGVPIALGHAIIEVPLILLIYFGFARFFQEEVAKIILYLGGAGMLFWLGIAMFRARANVLEKGQDLPYNSLMAGIMTSVLNPAIYLWWAVIGSVLIMSSLEFGITGFILLIPVHWLCDLAWMGIVSFTVYKVQSLWGKRFQTGLFITSSLLLMGFAGYFLVTGVQLVL